MADHSYTNLVLVNFNVLLQLLVEYGKDITYIAIINTNKGIVPKLDAFCSRGMIYQLL